jgi:hypothetical protein
MQLKWHKIKSSSLYKKIALIQTKIIELQDQEGMISYNMYIQHLS